ncbi:MAG: hypothetical protein H7X76_01360 [Prolixibacteraceae bacterium]|nr:hypothetical protein [Burkholderiales bacterium]
MALWGKVTLIGLGVIIAALPFAVWLGTRWQQRALSQLVEPLVRVPSPESAARVNLNDFKNLPVPVARYFRRVLQQEQSSIRLARFKQVGTLRTNVHSDRWLPFEASQIVAPPATAFVWNARVAMAPLLHVRVRDALIAGQGSGQVSFISAFPVAAGGGNLEMNSGALHRYLAEAVWYPTALFPSAKLRWSAIDDNTALATLTDKGVTVSLEFRFNTTGEVTGIYTPARWGSFDGGYKQVPWEGHFRNYEERGGIVVPSEGEVGWYSEGEWRPVWKGRIAQAEYELAR